MAESSETILEHDNDDDDNDDDDPSNLSQSCLPHQQKHWFDINADLSAKKSKNYPANFTCTSVDVHKNKNSNSSSWHYTNTMVAAPMVRVSRLPFRLQCRRYGAHIVYTEEVVAQKLRKAKHRYNSIFDLHELVLPTQTQSDDVIVQTYVGEPLVVQMGASNAQDALAAAEVACQLPSVRAIDLNCGCPVDFSVKNGMGANLLKKPDIVDDIIRTLKRNLSIPVTCKIRLLTDTKQTLDFIEMLTFAGVDAICVHARRVEDRPRHPSLRENIPVFQHHARVPLIYNGDVFEHADFELAQSVTHCTSIMSARGCMWNPSIFSCSGPLPVADVAREYVSLAMLYGQHVNTTKYSVAEMVKPHPYNFKSLVNSIMACNSNELLHQCIDDMIMKEQCLISPYRARYFFEDRPNYPQSKRIKTS